ncbi:YtxH domain-containing protein [[Phormidium ambiguum] IAM M-71]|uniref:YtxH domain-containing protein n=1 Tax=[Phormidium ambiguum] IAM M-71 TaxID=454136 RepID=UPI000A050457|nr:YtxH domain-containing protein [Phormidium ambiguum]
MSENRSGSSGSFIGGMLLGAALGTITGLLLAPRTGKETRHLLKKSAEALPELAEDLSSSVQLQADRLSESALRNWDSTLTRLKEAIAAGVEATVKEQQNIQRQQTTSASDTHLVEDSLTEVYSNSYTSEATAVKVDPKSASIES